MNFKHFSSCILLSICSYCLSAQEIPKVLPTIIKNAVSQKSVALIVITDQTNITIPAMSVPSILPYKIDLKIQGSNSTLARELKSYDIWGNRQIGWVVIGTNGQFIIAKDGLPDAETLEITLRDTNCVIPLVELQKFYRQNNNRLDIMFAILEEQARIGNATVVSLSEQDQNADFTLTNEQDDNIWGEYARLFRTNVNNIIDTTKIMIAIQGSHLPKHIISDILPSVTSLSCSPNLIAMSHSILPKIESALINSPYDAQLWKLWGLFRPNRGGMQIDTFADLIRQSRFRDQEYELVSTIIEVLQEEKGWKKLIELLEPVWDNILVAENQKSAWAYSNWRNNIFPLFKAYIETDQFRKAETIIKTWITNATKINGTTGGAVGEAKDYVQKHSGSLPSQDWPN